MLIKLFFSFLKIGLFSLGGGYAMIPLISNEVVTVNHWLDPGELVDIIAVSQATPGPIAINCATFVGAKICGFTGAVVQHWELSLRQF